MVTSIFSAGNTYTYCATRSLYGLAIEGRAPKVLRYCTKSGVPLICFCVVMVFPCLAFLQVSSASNNVLTWLTSLITAGGVINYIVMTITYIFFHKALQAQGVDRKSLPYTGWFQPYSAWIGLVWMSVLVCVFGYASYTPWSVDNFFINYVSLCHIRLVQIAANIVNRLCCSSLLCSSFFGRSSSAPSSSTHPPSTLFGSDPPSMRMRLLSSILRSASGPRCCRWLGSGGRRAVATDAAAAWHR